MMQSPRLDHDMLVEILTRLPLKSFSRSKCVSKSWCSLVSDDYVRNKLPLIVAGIFQRSGSGLEHDPAYVSTVDGDFVPADLGFVPFQSNSTLIDCCNGLLLFYSSLTSSFHVCNPTTRRHAALPKPVKSSQLSIVAFDPYHSQQFMVVNFARWLGQGAVLEIFRSESGRWDEHQLHWGISTDTLTPTMHYVEGILYILGRPKQMVGINLRSVTCHVIELPEATRNQSCVGKLGGRLHYSVSDGNQLRVWKLKGMEWVLKHCVSMKMGKYKVLGFNPESDVIYMLVGEKLVAYDLCEEKVTEIWELGMEKGHLIQVWAFPFGKNLEDCLANVNR